MQAQKKKVIAVNTFQLHRTHFQLQRTHSKPANSTPAAVERRKDRDTPPSARPPPASVCVCVCVCVFVCVCVCVYYIRMYMYVCMYISLPPSLLPPSLPPSREGHLGQGAKFCQKREKNWGREQKFARKKNLGQEDNKRKKPGAGSRSPRGTPQQSVTPSPASAGPPRFSLRLVWLISAGPPRFRLGLAWFSLV